MDSNIYSKTKSKQQPQKKKKKERAYHEFPNEHKQLNLQILS